MTVRKLTPDYRLQEETLSTLIPLISNYFVLCTKIFSYSFRLTGRKIPSIRVGSYNCLGFAEKEGPCHDAAQETTQTVGVSVSSCRAELGKLDVLSHRNVSYSPTPGLLDIVDP